LLILLLLLSLKSIQPLCLLLHHHFTTITMFLLLGAPELREIALRYLGITKKTEHQKELEFHKHYGSSSLSIASMWFDLCHTDIESAKLSLKERQGGVKMFLAAHFYLWSYTKNSHMLASRFNICEKYARGKYLWNWIRRIKALSANVITWPSSLDSNSTVLFAISIDGVDKKGRERKHPTLNQDSKRFTPKHHHAGCKWQIALSVQTSKCVHIFGPCRGGMGDKTMLKRSGVLDLLKNGKVAIVDRGYINEENRHKLSWPNPHDSKAVNNFKARARLRHESFNGRMCCFDILSHEFRQSEEKHGIAFLAVATIVQYQMDNGSPLYDV
jgi:hypothetical protein